MMLSTLKDGYPALADGTSLKYLFTDNSGYATKKNTQSINGLFQRNETTGEYTFNSRENHAQFNASDDTFTLYEQIISSNFIWYPFGNFLPFNDIVNQCTQASEIDREYFNAVASKALAKYNAGKGDEYQTLSKSLTTWIGLMDAKYTSGWSGADAMNEYFNSSVGDKNFDFNNETKLLQSVYSIDYDEATDFYFGMEMYMEFIQPKDGLTGTTGTEEMVFYFTGDDDVWIYVDGVLFLDLSGIHRHVGGEIDFVNGVVKYYALDVKTGDVATTPYKTQTFAEILGSTEGLNAKGAFEDYSTHTFNFYYMERGAGSGVCRMNFNFPLIRQNSISVSKELSVDDGNVTELLGNPDFKFQVLKEDGSALFIGANTAYDIYDSTGQKIGTGTTDANGVFTLKAGQTAVFSGIDEDSGKYFVRELLDETVFEQYGKVTVDGQTTTTDSYTNVTVGTDSFMGIDSPVKDMADGSTSFKFNNNVATKKVGSLSISKEVEGDDTDADFKFTVTLDGELLPVGTAYTVTKTDKTTETCTVATAGIIQLKAGETALISNILAGSEFEVQETSETAKGYTVQYSGGNVSTDANGRQFVSGVIGAGGTVSVVVNNNENGTSVTIPGTKILQNPNGKEYTYQINLVEVDGTTGKEVENGFSQSTEVVVSKETATKDFSFQIPYKENEIESFPQDFFYKITETANDKDLTTEYDATEYIVQVTVSQNDDGTLSAAVTGMWVNGKEVSSITFTNKQLYSLTLTKKYVGGTIGSNQEFTFDILLSEGNDALEGTYQATYETAEGKETKEITFTEGTATVSIKADESITIHGLPYGVTWSMKETNAKDYIVIYKIDDGKEVTNEETKKETLETDVTVVYTNYAAYELPEAGGSGTNPFIIGGAMLMSIAMFLLYNNKKRGKEETASS